MIRGNLSLVAFVVVLAGCAHTYVDSDGNTHVVGMVHVVMPKSPDAGEVSVQSLQVRSFGLSLLSAVERTSLTFGYNDDTLVLLRGNACVAIGPGVRPTSFQPSAGATLSANRKDDQ